MNRFKNYAFNHIHAVSGFRGASWNAELTYHMLNAQLAAGVVGSVGEIGVHHGKYFILLYLSRGPQERAFCIDLFDLQEENIDHSGHGDMDVFRSQVETFAGSFDVNVIKRNSLDVTPEEILSTSGPARAISIDGGHYRQVVKNDLMLAQRTLVDGGIAIVDDYSNYLWPDVAVGVSEYLTCNDDHLIPFASSHNKIFLTTSTNWADRYITELTNTCAYLYQGMNSVGSHQTAIFTTDYKPPGYPLDASDWPKWLLKNALPWPLYRAYRRMKPPPNFVD